MLARAEGVPVMFPKNYAGKMDEAAAIAGFFDRFREHALGYLERHPDHQNALEMMFSSYRHFLLASNLAA